MCSSGLGGGLDLTKIGEREGVCPPAHGCHLAVSYTHLDVYKRQELRLFVLHQQMLF